MDSPTGDSFRKMSTLSICGDERSDDDATLFWAVGPESDEEFPTLPFDDFGAILMAGLRCLEGWVIFLRLELCFTISLKPLMTARSFSPSFIQSGFGP